MERKMPSPFVDTNISPLLRTSIAVISPVVNCKLICFQVKPLSKERDTYPPDPIRIVLEESMAFTGVIPAPFVIQFLPPSEDRQTPDNKIPSYSKSEVTFPFGML